jgi:hypothetical protein
MFFPISHVLRVISNCDIFTDSQLYTTKYTYMGDVKYI